MKPKGSALVMQKCYVPENRDGQAVRRGNGHVRTPASPREFTPMSPRGHFSA